jgi:hypothetical protein
LNFLPWALDPFRVENSILYGRPSKGPVNPGRVVKVLHLDYAVEYVNNREKNFDEDRSAENVRTRILIYANRAIFIKENRMARNQIRPDAALLEAALVGYTNMKQTIEQKMADIRRALGVRDGSRTAADSAIVKPKRTLSAAARRRIAAAQRKRWALFRAEQPGRAAKPRRTMSAAGRKRIAAAQRKRWALIKAQ